MTNNDYVFVEKNPDETSYVKITAQNEWNGTIFQYGNLSVKEDKDVDEVCLSFSYNVIESPLHVDMLNEDVGFKNYIGEMLQHIILDALETGEYRLGPKDTNNDSQESDNE